MATRQYESIADGLNLHTLSKIDEDFRYLYQVVNEAKNGDINFKPGSITGPMIGNNTITGTNIAGSSINSEHIFPRAITANKIADKAVGITQLADGAVTNEKVQDNTIDAGKKLAGYSITSNRLAKESVDERALKDRNIFRRHILQGAVGTNELADGAVGEKNIGLAAVSHDKLNVDAITMNKGKDFPLSSIKLAEQAPVNIQSTVKNAILDAKIFGADINMYYRLSFVANGHEVGGIQRFGVTIEERHRNTGTINKIIFSYNDETDPGNYWNARYKKGPNAIDKITVENGKYAAIITVDRSVIDSSSSPTFLNLNSGIGLSPSAIIDTSNYSYTNIIEDALTINRRKDYPLKSVKLESTAPASISSLVRSAVLDAKVFGAEIGKTYRITFIGNGHESNGKPRYGLTVEERNLSDGSYNKLLFVYNDDDREGNAQNANLQKTSDDIDTIIVDNGTIAVSVTIDRKLISESSSPNFLNLSSGVGVSPTAIIDPSNYSF